MVFDGSNATKISEQLGNGRYINAVAEADGDKYVMYCEATDGALGHVFVYDTRLGFWQKENADGKIEFMTRHDGALLMAGDNHIKVHYAKKYAEKTEREKNITYYFESGDIGYSTPDRKYVCRLDFKVSLELGASFDVFIRYDGEDRYRSVARVRGRYESPKTETVFIMPRRCEHFRIKVSGQGNFKLYSISRVYEISEY